MSDDFENNVKRRFAETFGIERLPMFADLLPVLEADGQFATARVLKSLMEEGSLQTNR